MLLKNHEFSHDGKLAKLWQEAFGLKLRFKDNKSTHFIITFECFFINC